MFEAHLSHIQQNRRYHSPAIPRKQGIAQAGQMWKGGENDPPSSMFSLRDVLAYELAASPQQARDTDPHQAYAGRFRNVATTRADGALAGMQIGDEGRTV